MFVSLIANRLFEKSNYVEAEYSEAQNTNYIRMKAINNALSSGIEELNRGS
jgi:hypothetical protein